MKYIRPFTSSQSIENARERFAAVPDYSFNANQQLDYHFGLEDPESDVRHSVVKDLRWKFRDDMHGQIQLETSRPLTDVELDVLLEFTDGYQSQSGMVSRYFQTEFTSDGTFVDANLDLTDVTLPVISDTSLIDR